MKTKAQLPGKKSSRNVRQKRPLSSDRSPSPLPPPKKLVKTKRSESPDSTEMCVVCGKRYCVTVSSVYKICFEIMSKAIVDMWARCMVCVCYSAEPKTKVAVQHPQMLRKSSTNKKTWSRSQTLWVTWKFPNLRSKSQ